MRRRLNFMDTPTEEKVRLEVIVERPLGFQIQSKRTRFIARSECEPAPFVVSGRGDGVLPDEVVTLTGGWAHNLKDGRYFQLDELTLDCLVSAEALAQSLGEQQGGIGKRAARRLLETFGDELLRVVEQPDEMARFGIQIDKARFIANYWTNRRKNGRALSQMVALGFSRMRCQLLLERYKDDISRLIFSNPYRLSEEISGVGFETSDRLARSMGIRRDDRERLVAGIRSVLLKRMSAGHCCFPEDQIVIQGADRLAVRADLVSSAARRMSEEGALVKERMKGIQFLYLPAMHACEQEVAKDIADRIGPIEAPRGERLIEAASYQSGIELHSAQKEAVMAALTNRLSVITGGPGTGKTATLKVLIEAFRIAHPDLRIALMAPTGRAGKRLSEATGLPARTIHRSLESSPEKHGFLRDRDNPLEADIVVIDEASMMDIWITRHVLRALDKKTIMVLVGDVDQLPSVDAGNVLADVISSGLVPTTKLTKVFRQAEGSGIAVASQRIRDGVMPNLSSPSSTSDLWSLEVTDPTDIAAKVVDLVTHQLPALGYDPMTEIQVLTPGHNHEAGTRVLNAALQEAINPVASPTARVQLVDRELRLGDRVMQSRNNYDLDVFNGDVGVITRIRGTDPDDPTMATGIDVEFDERIVEYPPSAFDELLLAYAITIHKSQGSEYPAIVTLLTRQHRAMLERNLFYTAVTRARKLCCIVSDGRAIKDALENVRSNRRYTALSARVREYHETDLAMRRSA